MPEVVPTAFPFLTREMLAFGSSAKLELAVTTITDSATPVLVRGLTRAGVISMVHTPVLSLTRETTTIQVDDIPVMIAVTPIATAYKSGQMWASLSLVVNGDLVFPLVSGYISSAKGLSWPNSDLNDTTLDRGAVIEYQGSNPAAGLEADFTMTSGERIRLLAVRVTLVTDANVALRRVHLTIRPDGGNDFDIFGSTDQSVSVTRNYAFVQSGHVPDEIDDNDIIVPLPADIWLTGNGFLTTATTNLQATDNFGPLAFFGERYFEGN